jgi:hypothetical protein
MRKALSPILLIRSQAKKAPHQHHTYDVIRLPRGHVGFILFTVSRVLTKKVKCTD